MFHQFHLLRNYSRRLIYYSQIVYRDIVALYRITLSHIFSSKKALLDHCTEAHANKLQTTSIPVMKLYTFTRSYENLTQILTDHKLAQLGDAYINFVYSLAISNRSREPTGAKVKGSILATAIKKAGLRNYLPSRMTRHMMADAAESLIVYAWLNNHITIEESIITLEKTNDAIEGFSQLLTRIKNKTKLS